MIDPKLNELTDKTKGGAKGLAEADPVAASEAARVSKPRAGLSINDTVAADANLSVGSRGVDVSGTRSGAGAGAGGTHLSPAEAGESPSVQMQPGPSGSGTTPLADGAIKQRSTMSESSSRAGEMDALDYDEVANHAYNMWHDRGRPHGSAEEDWHQAERELRERRAKQRSSAASA